MDKTKYISLVISTYDMFFFSMPILTPDMRCVFVDYCFPLSQWWFLPFFWPLITFCFFFAPQSP